MFTLSLKLSIDRFRDQAKRSPCSEEDRQIEDGQASYQAQTL